MEAQRKPAPRLVLAPMEGVADAILRELLTQVAGVDWCVTEFIRVTGSLLPRRTFYRLMPELHRQSRTLSGTPVKVQLLGSDPEFLALNAARAAELGAYGIDLNFGCPAPTVNRHRGGAALLDEPELLQQIAYQVRQSVPASIPVTAKMRLGLTDFSRGLECAQALAAGGVSELVIHGRTKQQGYKPPAYWDQIGHIRQQLNIPVIANGEIWSFDDYRRSVLESGCQDVMLGRGLVARPDLARIIRAQLTAESYQPLGWPQIHALLSQYLQQIAAKLEARYVPGRFKLWLCYLVKTYPELAALWPEFRRDESTAAIAQRLAGCQP